MTREPKLGFSVIKYIINDYARCAALRNLQNQEEFGTL